VRLYAESSAVLAWWLGEPNSGSVRQALADADLVVASDLTLVECDRVLHRAVNLGRIPEATAAGRHAQLAATAARWTILNLSEEIVERARQPFPTEPIRTLDALHLASAVSASRHLPGLAVLSLDERVRTAAKQLGFEVLPYAA
jgi:predicted nucleic acid-binding protein